MKKSNLLLVMFLLMGVGMSAQRTAVKLGVGGLFVTAPNLRFEQAVGDRMSFQITASYKIPTTLNFGAFESVSVTDPSISGFAIIPEFRFYFGKDKAGTIEGFYVAPYLKFHRYGTKTNTGFDYTNPQGEVIPLNPELDLNLTTLGGGIQLGYHWILGEHFSLDWHFLGLSGDGHWLNFKYDFAKDNLDLKDVARFIRDEFNAENPDSQIEVTDEQIEDIPVNGNSFAARIPFAFPGFRAGISIGYAF
jgi:hypothetical protein